ncbi:hypothetical protein SAMN05421874_1122 [Nonomuraea maritima]|uniref:Uncharacterized protein n=1 Tax=Nonomuraea maritima TaxID=683260 RepID=A0A1G9F998_9ACTN|nr:hypothetical protein SAMN05421874_1122 [Nonomuraea maritima]
MRMAHLAPLGTSTSMLRTNSPFGIVPIRTLVCLLEH